MTQPPPVARLLRTLLALALTLSATLSATLAGAKPLPPVEGEVIVAFKADAGLLRKHAMAARADAAAVGTTLAARASALGARVGRNLQAGAAVGERAQVMRAAGVDATTLARQLGADPDVAYAVPNGRKRLVAAPNDPLYAATAAGVRPNGPDSGQWYLRAPDTTIVAAIDIEAAWARTIGSGSVVVAVLDTGVRFEHPDLGRVATGGKLLPGYDFVSDTAISNDGDGRDADPSDPGDWVTSDEARTTTFSGCTASDSSWHGTSTASLIGAAANNGVGMAGTAPGVRLLPVRVLGKCFGSDADIIQAMRWAAGLHVDLVPDNANRARVINLSLGSDCEVNRPCVCSRLYQDVIDEVTAAGALVVVAGGNSAGHPVGEPGNCRGVLTVAALRHAGTKVGYSDLGPQIGIAAPGGNCVNTSRGSACLYPLLAASNSGLQGPVNSTWWDSTTFEVGTSFSAPLATGVAALMFSQRSTLTPAQVITAMKAGARPFPTTGAGNGANGLPVPQCQAPVVSVDQDQCYCNTSTCGAGMLDAGRAVAAVAGALARIDVTTGAPTAGSTVAFSGTGSMAASGAALTAYAWTLVSGGAIVTGFSSATNASTAAFTPTGPGSVTVQLAVTDSSGSTNSTTRTVDVAAAPVVTPPAVGGAGIGDGGGGGGGGAASWAWVAGVGLAAAVLKRLGRQGLTASRRKA